MKTPTVEDVLDALDRAGVSKPGPPPAAPVKRPLPDGPTFAGVCEILESMAATYVRYAQRCRELADSLRERDPSLQLPRVHIPVLDPVLSRRQLEIREQLCDGVKVSEIAKRLQVSISTVRVHVQAITERTMCIRRSN